MKRLDIKNISEYVERNIGVFHDRRLQSLNTLSLNKIIKRKNPYLFRAKNVLTAHDIVKGLFDAHLSSQEETIFGEFLEQLAVYVCEKVHGGAKSGIEGIDLEFNKGSVRYIVTVKSGPNWANAQQIRKMRQDFEKAKRIIRTNAPKTSIVAVNGCCYGRDDTPDKGAYHKLCGQRFWEFISGDKNLYVEIIEPFGHKTKEKNEDFLQRYSQTLTRFTMEFTKDFCDKGGKINWKKLVRFNSSKRVVALG